MGDTTPPSKVLGLAVGSITANSIDLSWTSNTEPDLDHYNVYRSTTTGFVVNTSTIPLAQSAISTYSDTGLPQSSTYYYKVAPVDTSGNKGNISDEKSGTTLTQIFYNVPISSNTTAALGPTTSLRYGEEVELHLC